MYDLITAQEIRKRIRNHFMKDVSLKAINHLAQKLGYNIKTIGGKKGYNKSAYTAIQRHWNELLVYDNEKPHRPTKQQTQGDYYMYNGERDNKDYDWEVDESVIREAVNKTINSLLIEMNNEQRALQTNIFGGVDDETEKNKKAAQKKKKAEQARIRRQEKKEQKEKEEWRRQHDEDSRRMPNGGLFGPDF